jgi:hypothetical protein
MSPRYSHNRFLCRAATLASKLGTLMSSDGKAEDSTVFVSGLVIGFLKLVIGGS